MNVDTYNQSGEKIGVTPLPKEVFEVKLNNDLVHQVVVSQMANRRQGTAHAKTRGEVRGGGRKPWRQKGTGRARHGSIRSPIWRGGGVTFGPRKDKNYKKTIPTKMRRKALLMVLTAKAQEKELIILDDLKLVETKTKIIQEMINKLPIKGKTSLIALPKMQKNVILSVRNIPKVDTIQAKDLNCLDILSFKYLIIPQESLKIIQNTFFKK